MGREKPVSPLTLRHLSSQESGSWEIGSDDTGASTFTAVEQQLV
jgi:hypothetical protein